MDLADNMVFRNVAPAIVSRLHHLSRRLYPRDGAEVFVAGDAGDAVYAIAAGPGRIRIGVERTSKGMMVEIFQAGDLFGEIAVLDGSVRTASAVAEGRVELVRVGATAFLAALAESPALGLNLCRVMAHRLRRTVELAQDATFDSLECRLARQLLYLAKIGGQKGQAGVRIAGRFSQGDLADLLGTTNRSIITVLNSWRARGIVANDVNQATLTIIDEGRFASFAAST